MLAAAAGAAAGVFHYPRGDRDLIRAEEVPRVLAEHGDAEELLALASRHRWHPERDLSRLYRCHDGAFRARVLAIARESERYPGTCGACS